MGADDERARRFRARLEEELCPVLGAIRFDGAPCALHAGHATAPPALSGAKPASSGRNTLTQLSTRAALWARFGAAPFTHAVQLELSLRLRRHLAAQPEDLRKLALALVAAAG